jgi:hypothetical protein
MKEYPEVDFRYVEVDLKKVVERKVGFIKKDEKLMELLKRD